MAAPGLDKKDFNIELSNHMLSISAEKEDTKEEDGYSRREYSYNSFRRSFSLPPNVNEQGIDAKYDNGILRVSIPKAEEAATESPHRIEIA